MKRSLFVALLVLAGCQQKIQHDLDESQANEIESLLTEAGIEARKVRGGGREAKWAISVPADRTTASIKLLNDHGLPRKQAAGFAEVFGKGSMVPTATEESALFIHALSGELSRTLGSLEGVVNARVHLVAQPVTSQQGFRQPPRSRAAVLLKAKSGEAAALDLRCDEIRALVAGSVAGLEPADVAVMVSELPAAPALGPLPRSKLAARWPLVLAAMLVALLSTSLVLALLHARRLRIKLACEPAATGPAGAEEPALPLPANAAPQRAA